MQTQTPNTEDKRDTTESIKYFLLRKSNLDAILLDKEREWINKALAYTDGNKTKASKLLGMTFRSFRYRLTKNGSGITGYRKSVC